MRKEKVINWIDDFLEWNLVNITRAKLKKYFLRQMTDKDWHWQIV